MTNLAAAIRLEAAFSSWYDSVGNDRAFHRDTLLRKVWLTATLVAHH